MSEPEHIFPGPDELGRGLVLRSLDDLPAGWEDYPRVILDEATLNRPEEALELLHQCWSRRRRVVIFLQVDPAELRVPEKFEGEPYGLAPTFEFPRERLFFLVWANNYDALEGPPVWKLTRAAQRLGAQAGRAADVILQGGSEVWLDGGPRGPLPLPHVHRESLALGRLEVAPESFEQPQELAEDQLEAVTHGSGAARIIAPAGSGKTRVLTSRLRHLIVDRGVERQLVTAVAYNRRAAREMQERTQSFKPRVMTLHALGFALLRQRGEVKLLEERQLRNLLRDLVKPSRELSKDPLAPYLDALARVRLGLVEPQKVEGEWEDVPDFAQVYRKYRRRLKERNAIDYDEQIYGAIEYLLENPKARQAARRACRHLLVDEFQDLTPAYLLLVRLLSAPSYQVFGVGDDDQVIYGHSGADPDYLVRFDRYFPESEKYALQVNYRCPPSVIEAAGHLLTRNRQRVEKTVSPAPDKANLAESLRLELHPQEKLCAQVVRWVQEMLVHHEPGQVALLTRVNALLLPLQVSLWQAGIPIRATLDTTVLQRTGIRTALAYLRAGLASRQRIMAEDIFETVRRPSRYIRRKSLEFLERQLDWSVPELEKAARNWEHFEREGLDGYLYDLQTLGRTLKAKGTAAGLAHLRRQIGLEYEMRSLDTSTSEGWGKSHGDDLLSLEQLALLQPDPAVFEDWLRQSIEASRQGEGHGVRLSSIHRVKGMEWEAVGLYAANASLMPHRLSSDKEEERRVFHVAMTRARSQLCIFADKNDPSPFLDELQAPKKKKPKKKKKKKKKHKKSPLKA